jgi:hypothetical protein
MAAPEAKQGGREQLGIVTTFWSQAATDNLAIFLPGKR